MHYLRYLARLGTADIHAGGAQATRTLIEALLVRADMRVLELGCGTGKTVARLMKPGGARVVGIDRLSEMVLVARRRLRGPMAAGRCAVVQGNVAVLPFIGESFDRVYAESVLGMQTEDEVQKTLAETFRVLKPGGLFVANEMIWKPHIEESTVTEVNKQCELDFGLRQASQRRWAVDRWLDEMRRAGLEPLAWDPLVARRREQALRIILAAMLRRLRLVFSPSLWNAHYRYSRLLAAHRADGALIEARLFVAARPS
jgi:ubiquinone/menaquinone biosynthesis C-methylase UbiE